MKIALITSFAEYHLLELLIPNIIEIINPDKIIISEGKMPNGPENKGWIDEREFNQKWTFNGSGVSGFDWEKTKSLEEQYNGLVEVRQMNYQQGQTATDCYIQSIIWSGFSIGDEVYCLESDSFLYEGDTEIIKDAISKLKIGEGLSVKYVDFIETQFYTENINLKSPKYRRFVYKFDNIENFRRQMGQGYLTQNYPELLKIESFFIRHYCWFRPHIYKQLRYDLIYRSNPQYWKDFNNGLEYIRYISECYSNEFLKQNHNQILIRPSRQDAGRFAQFIDVEHPKAIKSHPNFICI